MPTWIYGLHYVPVYGEPTRRDGSCRTSCGHIICTLHFVLQVHRKILVNIWSFDGAWRMVEISGRFEKDRANASPSVPLNLSLNQLVYGDTHAISMYGATWKLLERREGPHRGGSFPYIAHPCCWTCITHDWLCASRVPTWSSVIGPWPWLQDCESLCQAGPMARQAHAGPCKDRDTLSAFPGRARSGAPHAPSCLQR